MVSLDQNHTTTLSCHEVFPLFKTERDNDMYGLCTCHLYTKWKTNVIQNIYTLMYNDVTTREVLHKLRILKSSSVNWVEWTKLKCSSSRETTSCIWKWTHWSDWFDPLLTFELPSWILANHNGVMIRKIYHIWSSHSFTRSSIRHQSNLNSGRILVHLCWLTTMLVLSSMHADHKQSHFTVWIKVVANPLVTPNSSVWIFMFNTRYSSSNYMVLHHQMG